MLKAVFGIVHTIITLIITAIIVVMQQCHAKVSLINVVCNEYYLFLIDVGIVTANCEDGEVRLVGGETQYEGRVEMCINRVWGTLCSRNWNWRESNVVCRQLGHMGLGA